MMNGPRSTLLQWSEKASLAFETLKRQVASAPVLQLPDMKRPFILVTDASDVGTGAMLAQRRDGKHLVPVTFFHHTLTQAERNYPVTDRELLAVILAIKKFRVYLSGQPFDLITDHAALKWINSLAMDEIHGRRARWLDYLQQFPMRPIHRPGTSPELSMADYLSRIGHAELPKVMQCLSVQQEDSKNDGIHQLTTLFSIQELTEAQHKCPALGPVMRELREPGSVGSLEEESKCILRKRARLRIGTDGVLRYSESKGRSTNQKPSKYQYSNTGANAYSVKYDDDCVKCHVGGVYSTPLTIPCIHSLTITTPPCEEVSKNKTKQMRRSKSRHMHTWCDAVRVEPGSIGKLLSFLPRLLLQRGSFVSGP